MSLALATLIYEWPRYLAAILALAFSGLIVLFEVGVFVGIIHSDFATTERSSTDLFVMPPNIPSMVNGNPSLPDRVKPQIYLNPEVTEVASMEADQDKWVNIPKPGQKQAQLYVQIWGIDPAPGSATLPLDYPDSTRRALEEPGAIAVDESALEQLGVKLGDDASFNGHTVHVRAILHNYQSLDNVSIVASRQTVRLLGVLDPPGTTGPLLVKVKDPARAELVRDQLNSVAHGAYRVSTRAQMNAANEAAILSEGIISVLLGFSVFLAVLIGIGITSQTLRGAILSNIREFASLRALGISMGSLRMIVMELSTWVGVVGLLATGGLTYVASLILNRIGLPMVLHVGSVWPVCLMLMIIAVLSGAMSMGILKQSEPADLLR